jgi:hypothetical protein
LKNSLGWPRSATFQPMSTSAGIILAFRTDGANRSVAKILAPGFFNRIGRKQTLV